MSRFRYVLDPLCLVACGLYVLNRWCLPVHLKGGFLAGQFDDLLLIPAALPVVLGLQRWLGLRQHDERPTPGEVGMHLVIWSVLAEFVAPRVSVHAVSDWRDLLAYAAGALLALASWSCGRRWNRQPA